jgi:hypothetical protein
MVREQLAAWGVSTEEVLDAQLGGPAPAGARVQAWSDGVGLEVHVVASAAPVEPLAERHMRARVALERSQAAERAGERGPR